jgi:hypothetical protein
VIALVMGIGATPAIFALAHPIKQEFLKLKNARKPIMPG